MGYSIFWEEMIVCSSKVDLFANLHTLENASGPERHLFEWHIAI